MSNKISSVRIKEDASNYSDPIEFSTFADNVFLNRQSNSPTLQDTLNERLFRVGLANVDLNDIVTPGFYGCATTANSATITNKPMGLNDTEFVMQVLQIDAVGNKIQQILTSMNSGAVWTRSRTASGDEGYTWTIWTGSYGAGSVIPSNSNLDDYIEPGVYVSQSASVSATITNTPTTSYSFVVLVFSLGKNTAGRVQFALQTGSGRSKIWTRTKAGSTWTEWVNYNFFGLAQFQIAADTDLNTLFTTGTYRCTSNTTAATLVNCPTNVAFIMDIRHSFGASYVYQIIIPQPGNCIYIRQCKTDGTDFDDWQKYSASSSMINIASGTDLNNLLESGTTYVSPDSATTGSLINCPSTGSGGILKCYEHTGSRYIQIWIPGGTLPGVWVRAYRSTGNALEWTRWKKQDMLSWVGEEIPSNANLNNYVETGLYRCASETIAKTLLNRPIDTTFIMEVRYHESTSSRLQIIYQTNGQAQYIRYGTVSSNVWSWNPWHKYKGDASATTRKILFIGDSYCEGYSHDGNNNGWAWYCGSEYLNLQGTIEKIPVTKNGTTTQMDKSNYNTPNQNDAAVDTTPSDQFERMYRGGAKFYHSTYTTGYTFKELLIQAHTRFPNSIFTDIIVCGGYNDRTNTAAQIESAIVDFIDQAKTYYPNVQVYIGHVGYNKQGSSSDTSIAPSNWTEIRQHMKEIGIPAYKNCIKYGAIYLNNVEYALNETGLTTTDGYHPSEAGNRCIAKAVAKAFLYGSAPIVDPNLFYNSTTNTITNKRKILFLGDSYLEGFTHGTNNEGWGKYCGDALGLSTTNERVYGTSGYDPGKADDSHTDQSPYDDYERLYIGGIKFSNPSSDISFTSVIQIAHNVKFIDYDFTDIVACAGFGDRSYTETEILTGIETFCNTVKELYPNANIHIGHISSIKQGASIGLSDWATAKNNLLDHVIPAYHQCARYGARYLTNVEYALTDKGLMDDDGYCPNEEGNRSIGTAIANALLTGAAPFPVIHKKYLFLGDSYLEGFSNEESEFNDGWGKYCGDALGLVTTIVNPHLDTDPCKVTSSVNDSTPNDDYERLYVGGARMAYGTTSENLSFKYLITQAPTKFPGYKFTDIVACAGYGDRTYTIAQILSGIEEFCTKAKQLYPEATIHIGHISWSKLGTSSSAPSSSDYTTWHNYLINKTIPAYQQCSLYGAHYLNNVEYWMGDSGLGVDGYSANQSGNKKLGGAIANALLTGSAPLPYKNDYRVT